MASPLNFIFYQNESRSKNSTESIIGSDFRTVFVAGKAYTVYPPTINKTGRSNLPFVRCTRSRQFERSSSLPGRKWGLQQGSFLADSWWRKLERRTGKRNITKRMWTHWMKHSLWLTQRFFLKDLSAWTRNVSLLAAKTEVVGNDNSSWEQDCIVHGKSASVITGKWSMRYHTGI